MCWCFATINGRLGEIYFKKDKNGRSKIYGHCYVRKEDFKTKEEKSWIEFDTKKGRIVYRNKKYKLTKNKKPKGPA